MRTRHAYWPPSTPSASRTITRLSGPCSTRLRPISGWPAPAWPCRAAPTASPCYRTRRSPSACSPSLRRSRPPAPSWRAAEHDRQRFARDGGGPAELALRAERDKLAAELRRIETAESAPSGGCSRPASRSSKAAPTLNGSVGVNASSPPNWRSWAAGGPPTRARRRELVEVELPGVRERLQQLRERLAPVRAQRPAMEEAARKASRRPRDAWCGR
ncbi:hypothetical protein [Nonomuraea dietziae]|uniref:hypothetical protein n=1 Tax=Nonomuraea dietziae TaxID=65515 RepID=UPI0031D27F9A